jgi:hypothetical protein
MNLDEKKILLVVPERLSVLLRAKWICEFADRIASELPGLRLSLGTASYAAQSIKSPGGRSNSLRKLYTRMAQAYILQFLDKDIPVLSIDRQEKVECIYAIFLETPRVPFAISAQYYFVVMLGGQDVTSALFKDLPSGEPYKAHLKVFTQLGEVNIFGPLETRGSSRTRIETWERVMNSLVSGLATCIEHLRDGKNPPYLTIPNSSLVSTQKLTMRIFQYLTWRMRGRWNYRMAKKPSYAQWSIAIGELTPEGFLDGGNSALNNKQLNWINSPPDRFWADPFLYSHEGKTFLFFEQLMRKDGSKGTLHCGEIDPNTFMLKNNPEQIELLGLQEVHLSFPHIINDKASIFLLPEQAERGQVDLYEAVDFPIKWKFRRTLLEDFSGVDPVIFKHQDVYFLFISAKWADQFDNNLCLFYAEDISGPYIRHPMSPIKLGLKGSRMAGAIRLVNGRIFRFGQNCTASYGSEIVVFEILRLSRSEYDEIELFVLPPVSDSLYAAGLHSLSFDEKSGLMALDGLGYIM